MFENLKAFIRHGKYANEFKKRYPDTGETAIESKPGNNNLYTDSIPEYLSGPENLETTLAGSGARGTTQETLTDMAIDGNEPQMVGAHGVGYDDLAAHIVEQERKQKNKELEYPGLNQYEILDQMGEGAFSVVYKAKHLDSGNLVAIKMLRKFQMDLAQKQAVLKEVTIMRQLNHLNIVKFIEFIDATDYYYIVQELAIGGEIFTSIVKYTYFSEDLARHVIVQVAHAVRYLHEEVGIVHRDIKPENLLFQPIEFKPSINPISKLRKSDDPNTKQDEGEFSPGLGGGGIGIVKLADFGLSKQIWEHNTKTPCGTVGYTAPEIVRDERYSKEVDMWAIGCVLYTLLCGFPPFYDERIESLTEKVAKGQYTFLSPWWDEISNEAKYCVSRLLTVDPTKRYTIDELLKDPWVLKVGIADTMAPLQRAMQNKSYPQVNPIDARSKKYSKQFRTGNELYSPAAAALRDAFDISTAVHRMGEEAALSSKVNAGNIGDLLEEEEEEDEEDRGDYGENGKHAGQQNNLQGTVINPGNGGQSTPKFNRQFVKQNNFDLNLGGASILERRKNKHIYVNT